MLIFRFMHLFRRSTRIGLLVFNVHKAPLFTLCLKRTVLVTLSPPAAPTGVSQHHIQFLQ